LRLLLMSWAILCVPSLPALADCGRTSVRIVGTLEEQVSACQALDEVLGYFRANDSTSAPELTVNFQPAVFVRAGGSAISTNALLPVCGSYQATTHEIQILGSAAGHTTRRPWGLDWGAAMAFSVLEHEIIHAVIAQIMGDQYEKLPHAWHEALAYAVQIDLMPNQLREDVLARYPAEEGFSNTLQINELVYGLDPDRFAVAAYRTYTRGDRAEFLRRAMRFEFEMLDMSLLP